MKLDATTLGIIGAGAIVAYWWLNKQQTASAMNAYWYRERRLWRDSGLSDDQPYQHVDWTTGRITTA